MKKLTLIRHAKSDWSEEWLEDHERWLAPRGYRQIKEMWKLLKKLKPEFDYVLCSPAVRTVLTYEWLSEECDCFKKVPTIFAQEIYDYAEWNTEKMIELIENIEDKIESLVIIWHNDLLDELVEAFTPVRWLHIATLTIVEMNFNIKSWEDIKTWWEVKMFFKPTK